jgi:hypothetical protein
MDSDAFDGFAAAGLRDLMDRMGHSTTRAAKIYLHKSAGRDRVIADALSRLIEDGMKGTRESEETDLDQGEGHVGGTTH